eukprot:TRINITY_DN17169_c0_g1_i1.p1 TRINITY_DN17169_c0_g1~~TRINITY_DN17169_c0_g1_i1.p1  ORF type:complete len:157 (-),score=30.35 TRINITY_DN17169_c0_g1_i1:22-444(-)
MAAIEKVLEAGQKIWGKTKVKIEEHTTLNMHVGAGAVQPKRVFRFPAPGAVAIKPTQHQTALHLPQKAEDLGFVKHVDRAMATQKQRMNELDPTVDCNNLWGMSFESLPSEVPVGQTVYFRERWYDPADGVQKNRYADHE